jgi:hypothetical protein
VEVAVLLQEGQQSARVAQVVVAMEEWQKVQHQPQMGKQILAAAVVVVPVLAVEIGLAATAAQASSLSKSHLRTMPHSHRA